MSSVFSRFSELCRRLGGKATVSKGVMTCVVVTPEPFAHVHRESVLKDLASMIDVAREGGARAEIFIGNKLLGGWEEGVNISVNGSEVVVSSKVYGSPMPPNVVDDVIDAVIEKEITEEGLKTSVSAYVDQNPATDEFAGVAEASMRISADLAKDPAFLNKVISRVESIAEEYADLASEKLLIFRESL